MLSTKKLIAMLLIFMLLGISMFAQRISNEVYASSGKEFVSNGYRINWTIGEIFIESYDLGEKIQTLGFHQTYFKVSHLRKERDQNQIYVYPNPFSRNINIKSAENLGLAKVQIIDVLGKTVINSKIELSKDNSLDLSQLQDGFYYLQISTNNDYVVKILKQLK